MAVKLTKAECKFLGNMRNGHICASSHYGKGRQGGRVQGGIQELKTARRLEEKGILAEAGRSYFDEYNSGYCVHHMTIQFKLAIEGEAAKAIFAQLGDYWRSRYSR